jgi:uncharacterized membrane protein
MTVILNWIFLLGLLYRRIFLDRTDVLGWAIYGLLAVFILWRGWRLKRRVAELVIAAANRCELVRVSGKASRPVPQG